MKKIYLSIFVIVLLLVSITNIKAEATKNMLIVLDSSGSMLESFGNTSKMTAAKSAISDLLAGLDKSILVGLHPYAHISKLAKADACKVSELIQTFTIDRNIISNKVTGIQAVGSYTPTAYTLDQVKNDFVAGNDNVVILVTDGKETCDGNPTVSAKNLLESSVKAKTYVIGLGLDTESKNQLSAVALAGGGLYFDARDAASLSASFKAIQEKERPIDKTNTDALLGTEIRGGNGYDTAVDISAGKYRLDHHQLSGEFDYFKMKTVKGVPITISIATGEQGILYNSKTNSFEVTHLPYAGFKVMNSDRTQIDYVTIYDPSKKKKLDIIPEDNSYIYILIGYPAQFGTDRSYNPRDMNKNSIFTIETTEPSTNIATTTIVSDVKVDDNSNKIEPVQENPNDNLINNEIGNSKDTNVLYIAIGVGLLIIILLIVLIVIISKKKSVATQQINSQPIQPIQINPTIGTVSNQSTQFVGLNNSSASQANNTSQPMNPAYNNIPKPPQNSI